MSTTATPAATQAGPPLWLLAELTYRCPLHCVFCYNPVDYATSGPELGTDDWLRVLREARAAGSVQCGFSGGEPMLRDTLPVVDNLERALEHATEADDSLVQGIRMVLKQLIDTLQRHGVKPIESVGVPFDPEFHEAMSQAPGGGKAPGTILHQLEKGYTLHDRLLRPAKVVVASAEVDNGAAADDSNGE